MSGNVRRLGSAGSHESPAPIIGPVQMPAPILEDKQHAEPSAFTPENLLRGARHQKGLDLANVPGVCILDPDGDIVRELQRAGRARRDPSWACYHTDLYVVQDGDSEYGLIGGAVGASFAVLVAEELFASGCRYLLSITSAGQIAPCDHRHISSSSTGPSGTRERAITTYRRPGTPRLIRSSSTRRSVRLPMSTWGVVRGSTWTTDAPFRETTTTIAARQAEGLLAVEMEAAALYAFAVARGRSVLCFAHVTNQMDRTDGDFEKGEANGARDALRLVEAIVSGADRR
jgi:Phosphorylase superfamily